MEKISYALKRTTMVCAVYVLMCVAVCLAQQVVDHPVVQTTSGPVQGETIEYPAGRLARYLGVPYGRPPLGSLRFTPPQTPEPWTETLLTTTYGNRCYQNTFMDQIFWIRDFHPDISEDCLFLNVYVPMSPGTDQRAVMVWIHGGALVVGAGSDYPMEALSLAGDVITISINYRLDIFGFMATEDDKAPGNVGFLDQVLALRWVKNNIAAFGGDPEKVTIFGGSAGGWCVNAHMLSPMSRGLFTRAISQSGSLYGHKLETREERAIRTRDLAASLNCPFTSEVDMLTCLQSVPVDELLGAAFQNNYIMSVIVPATAGDRFLPSQPKTLWDEHQNAPGVDYMLGVNSEEAALFLWFYPNQQEVEHHLLHGVTPEDFLFHFLLGTNSLMSPSDAHLTEVVAELVKDQYIPDFRDKLGVVRGLLDGTADRIFVAPTLGAAACMAETDQKVYLYHFDQPRTSKLDIAFPTFRSAPEVALGASHVQELLFVFGWPFVQGVPSSWVANTTDQEKAISRSMVSAWTTFSKTGKMTVLLDDGSEMEWPEYDKTSETYLEWKYPMTSSSLKSRLRPGADSFWNVLVPALLEKKSKGDGKKVATSKDEL